MSDLHESQSSSLSFVEKICKERFKENIERIERVLNKHGLSLEPSLSDLQRFADSARVTINFHPDRLLKEGGNVMEGLYNEGRFKNQFETGISNGGLTAFKGGDRDKWEEMALGGSYQKEGVEAHHRPKYGAFDLFSNDFGAAPRFGSSHFRLKGEVNNRCTFTFGDTSISPNDFGVIKHFESVWAAVLESLDEEKDTLGVGGKKNVKHFFDAISNPKVKDISFVVSPLIVMDQYIETQIHGEVSLFEHVEAIVLDPSFKGTHIEELGESMKRKFGVKLEWTRGFKLYPEFFPGLAEFRHPNIPPIAEYVLSTYCNGRGYIEARDIGTACATVVNESDPKWETWGTKAECLQFLKQLWHSTVSFGKRN